jgi:CubicO group peptidase (beta-lactamase class C family)
MNIIEKIGKLFLISSSFLVGAAFDFSALDALMNHGIKEKVFPGAVALINYQGKTIYHKPFGRYTYDTTSPLITKDTLFDIASMTKVIATTAIAMQLYDARQLKVDVPVSSYLSYFDTPSKRPIYIHHLLTHTSGIVEKPIRSFDITPQELWQSMIENEPRYAPGVAYNYTCSNMIFVQKIIEKISGLSFEECFKRYVSQPLDLKNTGFRPSNSNECVPTEANHWYRGIIQGIVHDHRVFMLGGVGGNAGLFSNAKDLEKFMLMIMNDGKYTKNNKQYQLIQPETVKSWRSRQCGFYRGYGWEIGRHLSPKAFGHFGWTGVSIWADKDLDLFVILLTNRTYPEDVNLAIREFRIDFHNVILKIMFNNTEGYYKDRDGQFALIPL